MASELNLFERGYQYMFQTYPSFWLITLGTFFLHLFFYFGIYGVYFIAEHIPSLQKYKIQKDKRSTTEMKWKCFWTVLWGDVWPQLPMMLFVEPVFIYMGSRFDVPFPDWKHTAMLVLMFFVVEDTYFYWVHRLLHWGPFYTLIHKVHHAHTAPFGMAAEYAHPVETLILGFGSVLGPFVVGPHMVEMWVWLFFRLWQEVDAHCGYDFPWSLYNFIPFYGGSEFHDFHHMNFVGNYGSTLRIWDRICGTDSKYHAYKDKQRKLKE